ncbi:hypothetical protein M5689_020537 [Euphorbia peplus]|nr:hypothetical protein M5689_020537 [Euphorbia peplus]
MEWICPTRRRGWAGDTLSSISSPPPLPLLTIFAIVILLLCFSNYTSYKAHLDHSAHSFHFFFVLLPILLIIFISAYSSSWLQQFYSGFRGQPRRRPALGALSLGSGSSLGSFPWGITIFVVLLLVLISYQSSFHSKWFGFV